MSFERICALSDLEDDKPQQFQLEDVDVAVIRTAGEVFAIHDECSHAGGAALPPACSIGSSS